MRSSEIREPDNLRSRLLENMLQDMESEQREDTFYKADSISTWCHVMTGRFSHFVCCLSLLVPADRKAVLEKLGMDQQEFFESVLQSTTTLFNMSASDRRQVIYATEQLLPLFLVPAEQKISDFIMQPPHGQSSTALYSECQFRNLILYNTVEGREYSYQLISSIITSLASIIHAYQNLCIAINELGDRQLVGKALEIIELDPYKYSQCLEWMKPFYLLKEYGHVD